MSVTKTATTRKAKIFEITEKAFTPRNQINCSGYVREVILLSGLHVPDVDANHLVAVWNSEPSWIKLGNDNVRASKMAGQHYLVVAGWVNKQGHGHVVVILPGRVDGHARAAWGSLGHASQARKDAALNLTSTPLELHEVQYFATPVSAFATSQ